LVKRRLGKNGEGGESRLVDLMISKLADEKERKNRLSL